MRRLLPIILLLLFCARCHAKNDTAHRTIQTQYNRWSAAYAKNDTATLLRILAPDFTLKTSKGTVLNRSTYKAILLKRASTPQEPVAYKTQIKRLLVSRYAATAYTVETVRENKATGGAVRTAETIHIHQYRDKWVKRDSQWLLQFSETLAESQVVSPRKHAH